MGNNNSRRSENSRNLDVTTSQRSQQFEQPTSSWFSNVSGRSFGSISSHHTTCSVSRPWSRISRRRWKESTLTLPYESSKTAWPVSQLESFFLPDFPLNSNVEEQKYNILQEVSAGSFGKVFKVVENATQKVYALKVLSKSKIIKENAVQQVKDEVKIQRVCGHHPFIVNCPFHFQTKKRLFIVSDFVEGGELYQLLKTYFILPLALVQLYIAQIALAIDFLHNAGIIYRDLKPENILLDGSGNVQLIDFGLSKWLSYGNKTKTLCGTLLYMAPEVVHLQPYGHAADWWSLGVIACLMLTGQFPSTPTMYNNEMRVEDFRTLGKLPENAALDVPSKDLLLRLLQIDPSKRLHSVRALKNIAFYKGYNFEDVKNKKLVPNEILKRAFPGGPPIPEENVLEDFDTEMGIP